MPVNTRNGLKQYCLRRLGSPLVEINVDDTQVEDRIDEALRLFTDYHYSGTERLYYKHKLTQEDLDNSYITLPENIISVLRVLPYGSGLGGGMFNLEYQMRLGDYTTGTVTTIADFIMTQTHFDFLAQMLGGDDSIQFNRYKDRLIFNTMSKSMRVDDFIIIECWSELNPEEFPEIYDDRFVKRYATALIKQQWGQNLLKFEGATLPGNIQLNGSRYYEDATLEIEKLEDEIQDKYELPLDFMIG